MDWTTLLATGLGALIGVGSTLVGDRIRWRRDTSEIDRERLETRCVELLEALTNARDGISLASREVDTAASDRAQLARASFAGQNVYAKKYLLELIAPADVAQLADEASYELTVYRDAVADGAIFDDSACAQARRSFRKSRKALMVGMQGIIQRPASG
ncbi:hypothetical protein [Streptomyces jumonjinensis]|uniref:Uncharacterized protein n=1 Tax=Streptomyces jumonjinensis TaxID=1945 RepID=A0A646KL86_STRJU|nr:hypothetical protein [Streptomyces jumonjinensis]MQT02840.1 hypothetical protein [Streptomyces jumonjinensis]